MSVVEFDYNAFLDGLALQQGDILDVASDMFSIGSYCYECGLQFDPNHLIDAIIAKVGDEGTVMIRTFTWDFCNGKGFDIRKSCGQVGRLGNVARKRPDFQRTKHPIYNWMVKGKYADYLTSLENVNGVGDDSPFAFMSQNHAKFCVLGTVAAGDANTFFHYCENHIGVPYRKEKIFEGEYIDQEGKKSIRRYSVLVRPKNYSISVTDQMLVEWHQWLMEQGYEKSIFYDETILRRIYDCTIANAVFIDEIMNNDGKRVLLCNGVKGYKASGIDWDMAYYY